jgi:hypothetical protein
LRGIPMATDSLDVLAGVAVGTFLLAVVVRGNSTQLVTLAEQDKSFLPWAIAVGVLFYLRSVKVLQGPLTEIIAAAFIGLFLLAGTNIATQAKTFWSSIGG